MCLHRIIGKPEKTSGIGYKVYRMRDGKLFSDCYNPSGGTMVVPIEIGKTYNSVKTAVITDTDKKYKSGFHIFAMKRGAGKWKEDSQVIVKVQYKKARLIGEQNFEGFHKCIIADEITLLEIVK